MAYAIPVPGRNVAQLQQVTLAHNQAVQVITMGNKAVLCCKHEDLKNMSFRTHGSSYCCIPNCKNFRGKIPNMSFFQFPKDVGRCKTWVSFTTREDLKKKEPTLLPRSGFAICAAHFEDSMFMNPNARNRLIHCAIPTIFDPSCPPPPASIKELAARFSDNVQDNLQLSLEESVLCIFHRKFIKTVTALETDISDVRYCMACGSPIEVIKEVSPGAFQAICSKRHDILFTTEFASKCREWVNTCHNLDRIKNVVNLENKCHLCEAHFSELKDPSVTLVDYNDMQSNLAASELFFPSAEEVTVTTTPAPKGGQHMIGRNPPQKSTMPYPSLPSSFFSVGGYTTRLDTILDEITPPLVQPPAKCQFTQTDLTQKSVRECILRKNLKNCRVKICRLKKRITTLEEQLKKPPNVSAQMLSKELSKYLKGACLRVVQEQLKVSKATGRGIRWSEDFLLLAKIIQRESSKAYSILKRIIMMPTRSTIQRHQMMPGELPSLMDYLNSAFPSGQDNALSAEVSGIEENTMTELPAEEVNGASEICEEEDTVESENEENEMSDGGESDLNEGLPISTEDEEDQVTQQSVEVQVLQDETCVQLMSHEGMRIYEMYTQATASIQNDSRDISLTGNETAVTIINVIPVSKEN